MYTFSLSIAFAAVYFLCYEAAIRLLTAPLSGLPAWASNLIVAALASSVGAALCALAHRCFRDKRLAFGAFAVAFGWFILPPVALGTALTAWLWRRDRAPAVEPEPEWKRYVNRR